MFVAMNSPVAPPNAEAPAISIGTPRARMSSRAPRFGTAELAASLELAYGDMANARTIYLEYRKAGEFDMPGIVNELAPSSEAARFKDSQQKPKYEVYVSESDPLSNVKQTKSLSP